MAYQKTEGLCIRKRPFSNTSEIVTFFSPDCGRFSALAKGCHRMEGKRPPKECLLMATYEVVFVPRRSGLATLCSSSVLEQYDRIHRDFSAFLTSLYVCEHANLFTLEEHADPDYYDRLRAIMRQLNEAPGGERLCALFLEIATLKSHGSVPDMSRCVACGRPQRTRETLRFCSAEGGIVCPECPTSDVRVSRVSSAVRAALLSLLRVEPEGLHRLEIPPRMVQQMTAVTRKQLAALVNRPLLMWPYLDGALWRKLLRACEPCARAG